MLVTLPIPLGLPLLPQVSTLPKHPPQYLSIPGLRQPKKDDDKVIAPEPKEEESNGKDRRGGEGGLKLPKLKGLTVVVLPATLLA